MSMQVCYERDVEPGVLRSKTVAVIGYGNQGQAHARNLRDAGHRVVVAQRPGGPNHALAVEHGFQPVSVVEATRTGDLLILALPDETMAAVYDDEIAPYLRPAGPPETASPQTLGFIHGFNIRFGRIEPPAHVHVVMVAPKGPGTLVRESFVAGGGLTCLVAVHQQAEPAAAAEPSARQIALGWGAGIGGGRGGMIEATFAQECEADLFGEQTVLCGGMIELMKAAFDVLVEAGYPEQLAYFECIHEVKQIADMQYAAGLAEMRSRISNTAAYGGLVTGPRLINDATRREMRRILDEIRSGEFARRWIAECAAGRPRLTRLAEAEAAHPSEAAGRAVRDLARPGR